MNSIEFHSITAQREDLQKKLWQERVRRKVTPGDVFSTLDADQSGTITIEASWA